MSNILEFESEIVRETSMSPIAQSLGKQKSTMTFYRHKVGGDGNYIEWCTSAGEYALIGILTEMVNHRETLVDYDGVFTLNAYAIKLLEQMSIHVPQDLKDFASEEFDGNN